MTQQVTVMYQARKNGMPAGKKLKSLFSVTGWVTDGQPNLKMYREKQKLLLSLT